MAKRLAPPTSPDTAFFWEALKEQKLVIQRCKSCATLRHPPRPMCPSCTSLEWDTLASSGKGVVYSYAMPHHPRFPFFEYPYIVVLVELAEGVRLVSNLIGIAPDQVRAGMPVEVFYETFDDGVVLHQFRPVAGRPSGDHP